jgi:DNA-binding CsgD family transcriptional regulator
MIDSISSGREAFRRQAWSEAYAYLLAADRRGSLAAADLEMLGWSAHLIGERVVSDEMLGRAHRVFLDAGDVEKAAKCAFWIGFRLIQAGEHAQGSGWLARSQRVLEDAEVECVVQGFLLLPRALGSLAGGDPAGARERFVRAGEIARRFSDPDLLTLSRLGQGQALIQSGQIDEGGTLLDEVMVAVTAGDVSPIVVGLVYCSVLSACHDIFDMRRAKEWTAAFTRWCESMPEMEPFRGECLTRRAEILQVDGDWADALDEAQRAGDWLTQPPGQRAAGGAFYCQAELHRLRGEFAESHAAYREAARWGRSPQPGMALLRLAEGQVRDAAESIRRVLEETDDRRHRATRLAAAVEILLAAGDVSGARTVVDELSRLAADVGGPYLDGLGCHAEGSVLAAEGRHHAALVALRRSLALWRELGAPYEAARSLVRIGLSCRALGDADSCEVELAEARRLFKRLGAPPDLERIDLLSSERAAPGGLTPRELEVLTLVATGMTNRAVAEHLFISEKTVARHVSNIFSKLAISSRAAATAYAYEHDLV